MQANPMTSRVLDRRSFMQGAAGLTFGILAPAIPSPAASQVKATRTVAITPWVTLSADGKITILGAAAELGQGTRTHQPMVLAEELDADWAHVTIASAPPDDKLYGNPGVGGIMYTNAARTLSGYYVPMRTFGAQIRRVLMEAASRHWNVPVGELSTKPSVVVHARSNRQISYGEIASFIELPAQAPQVTPADFKTPDQYRLLGKDVMREDIPSKTRGSALYCIDVQVPGMLYGAVLRSPVEGGAPATVDESAARKVQGIIAIVRLPYGVGIVADRPTAAFAAKDALKVTWNGAGKANSYDSDAMAVVYSGTARDMTVPGSPIDKAGDVAASMGQAAEVIEGSYLCDMAYHAQMEPLGAVASVIDGGASAEIWVGTQGQTIAVDSAARTLGISADRIKLHDMMVGGAYGRRGHREHEYLTDALLLSKATGKPVKVIWTREDDVRNGRFRPLTAHYLRAGFDSKGDLIAWHHRVVADEVFPFMDPVRFERFGKRDIIVAGGADSVVFNFPNRLSEVITLQSGVRTSSLRGIGYGPNRFAVDAFMDELARKRDRDPVQFRLGLLKESPRGRKAIERAADMAKWTEAAQTGRAKGFSFIEYGGTFLAAVAEVSVDKATGVIKVHNFWCVIDPGFAVQPDNVVAQTEGGIIYGLGHTLTERISIKEGAVQESNFYDYVVPRMRDIPNIEISVISDPSLPPTGIGEQSVPIVAPAISNAFAMLTGKRLRAIPMTPDRVLAALKTGSSAQ